MVQKIEFYIPSSDGKSRIHGIQWLPEGRAIAVVQITHGMIEYIDRYDEFARYLAGLGIAVVGHDHLGHGKTSRKEDYGHFSDCGGADFILGDIRLISQYCTRQYPELPHFILGHSMGTFLLRCYLNQHRDQFAGAILLGTGDQPLPLLLAGMVVTFFVSRYKGPRYHSNMLHNLVVGNFNRAFYPVRTNSDWLTRDFASAYAYSTDPLCGFHFTCRAYLDFFKIMLSLKGMRCLKGFPDDLPVLLLSGDRDPVGQQGKGVRRVFKRMKASGIKHIGMKLYPGARHELLKEVNRGEVFEDISGWVMKQISGAVE